MTATTKHSSVASPAACLLPADQATGEWDVTYPIQEQSPVLRAVSGMVGGDKPGQSLAWHREEN